MVSFILVPPRMSACVFCLPLRALTGISAAGKSDYHATVAVMILGRKSECFWV
jgi:hypothetical protein